MAYLALPEVETMEPFLEGFGYWTKPTGGMELCLIIGTRMAPGSLGPVKQLTAEQRGLLSEPMSVVIDEGEFARLGGHQDRRHGGGRQKARAHRRHGARVSKAWRGLICFARWKPPEPCCRPHRTR